MSMLNLLITKSDKTSFQRRDKKSIRKSILTFVSYRRISFVSGYAETISKTVLLRMIRTKVGFR